MTYQLGSLCVGTNSGTQTITWGGYSNTAASSHTHSNNYSTWTGTAAYGDLYNYNFDKRGTYFTSMFEYLREDEISNILNILIERSMDKETLKGIFQQLLTSHKFSEDFIMNYIDYFDLNSLKSIYSSQIKSQEYPRLALLVQAAND